MAKYRKVIYHHVPKTAGSFIGRKLGKYYGYRFRVNLPYRKTNPYQTIDLNPDSRLFASHHAFENFQPRPREYYFTFLRHPVSMFYSQFKHDQRLLRQGKPWRNGWKILGYLKDARDTRSIRDFIDLRLEKGADLFPSGYFNLNFQRFHFVGITEEMDRSLKIMSNHLGVILKNGRKVNTTSEHDISYRLDEVRKSLTREIKIYRHRRRLLNVYNLR
jgi:hypothetical protein